MILFHPLQNRAMQFSLALLARLRHVPSIDYPQVQELGRQFYLDALYLEEVLKTLNSAGIVRLEMQNKLPLRCCRCQSSDGSFVLPRMPAGTAERDYLHYILQLPEAKLFLPEELRQQLQPRETWLNGIQRIAPTRANQARSVDAQMFQTILRAIQEKRFIRYSYRSKNDSQYQTAQAIPWKIEYGAYDKRWWIILYDPQQKRTIKAVLGNLRHVELGLPHDLPEQAIHEAIEELCLKDTPVELRVENVHNALQRCFLAFENQEFIHTQALSDSVFLLRFRFYRFDTEEILRKLLQLGPAVTLLQPPALKQELRHRLKLALERNP